ncbi:MULTISPECIES: cellulose biosynthesis cyclic di-GMP-binding regulatory protein BcsB [unclassified Pigmentiphaga]|uniref:cellulose biosynthesis cyclic di-GMP-binding regulatory protein BcsB n=1 Tax=unclassified Pigmentiphaga TaxID=2626614 RepID=UPI000B40964B|nr:MULTISPECIES: cellulose biosynthesis cyclic di-GMP-binding regulatory protein BcsB [unclassified Pigmentiphaga]OVZ62111.1 cellulose synthase regulator BcsB [Pigmentiphaga sp. NML030171]
MTSTNLPSKRAHQPAARPLSLVLAAAMLLTSLPLRAQPAAAGGEADAKPEQLVSGGRSYGVPLKRLGASTPMTIRGVEGSFRLPFDIRADEVVSSAQLRLRYTYSPALLEDLSHINVLVNGEVAASIPVPKDTAGKPKETVVALPPQLITQFNNLNVQLIGHYTMECEDPLHSSLWANISNQSTLELTVTPLVLANDLSILPLPFFDRRDSRPLSLPFVFAAAPDNTVLEAAGILSSWFGALASYRGARFPTAVDQLPAKGNAIVMATGELRSGGLDLPAPSGPTVTIVPNPNDMYGKLLVLGGRDAKELKRAAQAVVTGSSALTGHRAVITQLAELEPRKPYDAPNWLRSDRPVKFGELVPPATLNVSGFAPPTIPVNLRLPPDLFGWRESGIPLDLKYRYTPQQMSTSSTMTLGVNDHLVKSFPLPSIERLNGGEGLLAKLQTDSSIPVRVQMALPLQLMPPRATLQFRYQYDYIKEGQCRDVIIDNVRGAIEPDSTIDISGFRHYIAMPNLAVFHSSGFPFTRMADLSQTAVILPDNAGTAEYSAYLGVLGRLSESTGYPALNVTVARADQAPQLADKDLLLIASGDNQPLLRQWSAQLPVSLTEGSRRFNLSDWAYQTWRWIVPNPHEDTGRARSSLSFTTDGASVVFAGFESPLRSGRSVVAISATRPESLAEAVDALIGEDRTDFIEGSVSVVRGKQVDSLMSDPTYHVGSLGWFTSIQWYAARQPWILLLLAILGIAVLGVLTYIALRARAARRLSA